MKRLRYLSALVVCTASYAQQPDEAQFRQLYDERRWFDLRDAVQGQDAPPFYRAAVASALNRPDEAVGLYEQTIRESSDAATVTAARDALAFLYLREGRIADLLRLADDVLAATPDRADVKGLRDMLAGAGATNQQTLSTKRASFECTTGARGVHLPLTVNGRPVTWLLDLGLNMSVLSESEAAMLGFDLPDVRGEVIDAAGGSASARSARAERMTIGSTELRDVAMGVLADDNPAWSDTEPGGRGIIGLPVALALENVHWTSDGMCETGPVTRRSSATEGNLVFGESSALVRVLVEGRPLIFALDTGNVGETQLWAQFAADFPAVVAQGTRDRVRLNQFGGSSEHEVTVLPEVTLQISGFDMVLRSAKVFSAPVGAPGVHGNLGMDLLSRPTDVTIDFQSMTITLR
jgi:hypothetical protein